MNNLMSSLWSSYKDFEIVFVTTVFNHHGRKRKINIHKKTWTNDHLWSPGKHPDIERLLNGSLYFSVFTLPISGKLVCSLSS